MGKISCGRCVSLVLLVGLTTIEFDLMSSSYVVRIRSGIRLSRIQSCMYCNETLINLDIEKSKICDVELKI